MTNIWGFILQTVSASLVAGLLLIVKNIFKDKLTPRWQYGIWIIFVLRIIIPVRADRFVLLPFGLYLEIFKNYIEAKLNSAFSSALEVIEPSGIIPYITDKPVSITDFIFLIYIVGIIVFLCYYLLTYVRLRVLLKKGTEISLENNEKLKAILSENKIKRIKVVSANGINSAFICGVLSPVLVIPSDRETDEKVLLHEIKHLKNFDGLQNIFWCILRSLHWCNPFMQYVFNIIGNDMETLCDQRVLEKLEGEERREYGMLLLNEANKKYARMPGTTSVSNGGKNISKRIEAIARFKKYPKGMALVSVCIAITLSFPCLFVSASFTPSNDIYFPCTEYEYQKALVYSKINRCSTVAGAIDTYAKALMESNGIMLLTASPLDMHNDIIENLLNYHTTNEEINISIPSGGRPYSVFNLIKTEEEKYIATLIISIEEDGEEETDEYRKYGDTLFIPIEIFKENDSWVVRETGERKKSKNHLDEVSLQQIHELKKDAPVFYENIIQGDNGTLTVKVTSVFQTDYNLVSSENLNFFTDGLGYDDKIHTNADFGGCFVTTTYVYNYLGKDYEKVKQVAIERTADTDYKFAPEKSFSGYMASSSTDGTGFSTYGVNDNEKWDRTIIDSDVDSNYNHQDLMDDYFSTNKIGVYIDGKLVDTFTVEVNNYGE